VLTFQKNYVLVKNVLNPSSCTAISWWHFSWSSYLIYFFRTLGCLAYTSLVCPILEYGAVCWDPYRECQISALDRVQSKAAKFVRHLGGSYWESLAQCRKIARMCALYKAYTGERAWKAIGDKLRATSYLSRVDHYLKIKARKQRTYREILFCE
jgi:hypothetical protein